MNKITREEWLSVLHRLQPYGMEYVSDIKVFDGIDRDLLFQCLSYLSLHGFIKSRCDRSIDGFWSWGGVELTARGLDYLSDDGGITAEEKTITVKLDGDTIKALLCRAVDSAPESEATKASVKQKVKAMGGEALKDLTSSLISKGIENAPGLVQWLGTTLG
ncbi:hypothetical protein [Acetobacter sp. LMG 32666]|uniref:hypothetical protein n=1 Tax=Acetobacter sp. LMG 32666 TaxID=2959295 RepID=UPI0030C894AB